VGVEDDQRSALSGEIPARLLRERPEEFSFRHE
jgi:hypothetical protein